MDERYLKFGPVYELFFELGNSDGSETFNNIFFRKNTK